MTETIHTLMERRSVRKFRPEQVERAKLDAILEAGLYAPSGKGAQVAMAVVVQDAQTISALSRMNASIMSQPGTDPFYGAPTVVTVLADTSVRTYVEDGSVMLCNMLNAAWSLGVDSCWIHRARQVFESAAGQRILRAWGVPEEYVGIGHCILGYRDGNPPIAAPRRSGRILFPNQG